MRGREYISIRAHVLVRDDNDDDDDDDDDDGALNRSPSDGDVRRSGSVRNRGIGRIEVEIGGAMILCNM